MDLLKTITGRIVTGVIALAVIAGGISWWRMEPHTRQTILAGSGHILLWLGVVLVLPWATFAVIGWVARLESNLAGGVLVGLYAIAEAVLLAGLFHWRISGTGGWTFLLLGGLAAAVYNILVCDWIAEKVV